MQWNVTVVLFISVGSELESNMCDRPVISVMVMTNFTLLLDIVEKGYADRKKFLIVVPYTTFLTTPEFKLEMSRREAIGFSRWLWLTSYEDSLSMVKFSRFFLCLSLFCEKNSSIDVPADFIQCRLRRLLTEDSVKQIETFPKSEMIFTCQKFCADMPNSLDASKYMASVVRFLNLTSWLILRTDPNKTFEKQALDELRYLQRRGADFSMTPSPITFEKLFTSSQSLPSYYFESRLLSWKQEAQTIGGTGMFGVLDLGCWGAIATFVLLQIMIFRCSFTTELSDALCRVYAIISGQAVRERRTFTWKFNALSLYVAAFYVGVFFRNGLLSCLNIPIYDHIDDAKDLREAIQNEKIDRLGIPQFGHYVSAVGKGINKFGLLKVLDEANASEILDVVPNPRDCIEFWLEKHTHACFLVRPYEYLRSNFELMTAHMSEETGRQVMIGRAHSPWHHRREKLNLLSLIIFESGIFYDINRTVAAHGQLLDPPPSPANVLTLSDVNIAFIALGSTLFFVSAYHTVKYFKQEYGGEEPTAYENRHQSYLKPSTLHFSGRMICLCRLKSQECRSSSSPERFDSLVKSRRQGSSSECSSELGTIRDSTLRNARRLEPPFSRQTDSERGLDSSSSSRIFKDAVNALKRWLRLK